MNPHPDQWYGCHTYSQHGEDIVFLNIFRLIGIQKITWLDIGAHHPFRISNTALLYERGHRGINVEANPHLMPDFLLHRPEDVNLQVGVSDQKGSLNFYFIDNFSGRNTFDKHAAVNFVREYPEFKIQEIIKIPVITVRDIFEQCGLRKFPDLLSLDAEGLDEKIVRSLDLGGDGPAVICVEDNDSVEKNNSPMRQHLEASGYFSFYRAGANIIFVKKAYEKFLT